MQKFQEIIVREALKNDLKDIFDWRNDDYSRSMFRNTNKVEIKDHQEWFSKILNDPSRKIYIGLMNYDKIGVCRFDFDETKNISKVSITLNPSMRGKKLGFSLLENSITKYKKINNSKLFAEVRKENYPSIKIFEKCGFIKINSDKNFIFYSL